MLKARRQRRRAGRRVERARQDMPEGRIGARYLMREKRVFVLKEDLNTQPRFYYFFAT